MKIIVYVEGASDKLALQALLQPVLDAKQKEGIQVDFFEAPPGDRKKSLLEKAPRKAAAILMNDPTAIVVILPDLYPMNKGFPHKTSTELCMGIRDRIKAAIERMGKEFTPAMQKRCSAFCLKHDLEALVLASADQLRSHIGLKKLVPTWAVPVEDQNHGDPPKRVVERLFAAHGRHYIDTVDAVTILGASNYVEVAERCPQCFGPFVAFLKAAGQAA